MSFFDLSAKRAEPSPPNKSIGPGAYHADHGSPQRASYAPFGSLSSKKWKKRM
jgi:hypothetical protein